MPKIERLDLIDFDLEKEIKDSAQISDEKDYLDLALGVVPFPDHTKSSNYGFGNGVNIGPGDAEKLDIDCLIPFSTDPRGAMWTLAASKNGENYVFESGHLDDRNNETRLVSSFDTTTKELTVAVVSRNEELRPLTKDDCPYVIQHINALIPRLSLTGALGDELKACVKEVYDLQSNVTADKNYDVNFRMALADYTASLEELYKSDGDLIKLSSIKTISDKGTFEDGPLSKNLEIKDKFLNTKSFPSKYFASANPSAGIAPQIDMANFMSVVDTFNPKLKETNPDNYNFIESKRWVLLPWHVDVLTNNYLNLKKQEAFHQAYPSLPVKPVKTSLISSTGTGKTSFFEVEAKLFEMDFVLFQMTTDTTGEELVNTASIDYSKEKGLESHFNLSRVLEKMEKGNVLVVLDEADISPQSLIILNQLLSEGRTTVQTDDGSRDFICGPRVIIGFTSNGLLPTSIESRTRDSSSITVNIVSPLPDGIIDSKFELDEFKNLVDRKIEQGLISREEVDAFKEKLNRALPFITSYNEKVALSKTKRNAAGSDINTNLISTRNIENLLKSTISLIYRFDSLEEAFLDVFNGESSQLAANRTTPDFKNLISAIEPILLG